MAEFTSELQSLRPSFPFLDIDNMELTNQFQVPNNNSSLHMNMMMQNLMPFMGGSPEPEFSGNLEENFSGLVHCVNNHSEVPVKFHISSSENEVQGGRKRKETDIMAATMSENSTPAVSESGSKTKNIPGRGKRVKRNGTVTDERKSMDVVHVRARRGQATDTHSLAERVRRGKINEKLGCLQNIVPGCYKTMGMAMMLDEIINYVQSLQHQVEFLSMKLTAASAFYDFNSETDALETMQRARATEAKELAKNVREGYGVASYFPPTWSL